MGQGVNPSRCMVKGVQCGSGQKVQNLSEMVQISGSLTVESLVQDY